MYFYFLLESMGRDQALACPPPSNRACSLRDFASRRPFQPRFRAAAELKAGTLQAGLTQYNMHQLYIYAAYPNRKHLPNKARSFIDFLAERFARDPDWDH